MTTFHEDDLERIFRAGLTHHAAAAPTELTGPLPDAATASPDRSPGHRPATDQAGPPGSVVELPRPRTRSAWRWALPAAAAAAVLAIPIGAQLRGASGHPAPTAALGGSASATTAASTGPDQAGQPNGISADWRAESYGGVQIWVPSTWGWGGTPMTPEWNGGGRVDCSSMRAFTVPGSSAYEFVPDTTPYVGRPALMTDACGDGGPDAHPTVDAAWLGAPVETGTQTYADGVVRETREVGGVTVTVFGKDTDLRQRILDSAEVVDVDAFGCPTIAPKVGVDQYLQAGSEGVLDRMSICAYQSLPGGDRLLWSGTASSDVARRYEAALTARLAAGSTQRSAPDDGATLFLGRDYGPGPADGAMLRWDRVDFGANAIATMNDAGKPVGVTLAAALVTPWARDQGGLKAYVVGPAQGAPEVARYFRGILG